MKTHTDEEIVSFFKTIARQLVWSSEQLVDTQGKIKTPNCILTAHFVLNESINQIEEMKNHLRNDSVRKSRNDYLRVLNMEKEWKEDV